jgi:hypothetical protein
VSCSQTPSLWVVPVAASSGAFTGGPAQLSWHWSAESQISGRDDPLVIIPF